jgi:integrase/recombinase XerC
MNYVKEFKEDLGTLSPVTRQKYGENIQRFIDFAKAEGENTRYVKPADLYRYTEHLTKSKASPNTIYAYLIAIRLFYRWMHERGYMETDIAARLKIPKRENIYQRGHLTIEQARQLIQTMPMVTLKEIRNYTIVTLMLQAGLRCVEVSRLNVENFKHERGVYFIEIIRKGHVFTERLGINQTIFDQYAYYLESRDDDVTESSPAFVTHQKNRNARLTPGRVGRIVNQVLIAAGLKNETITAHSLRHTAAVTAMELGLEIYDVRILLGHTSVKVTEIYQRSRDAQRLLENPISNRITSLFFPDKKDSESAKKDQ